MSNGTSLGRFPIHFSENEREDGLAIHSVLYNLPNANRMGEWP